MYPRHGDNVTRKQAVNLVRKCLQKWMVELDMTGWMVTVVDKKLTHPDPEKTTYAEVKGQWEYKTIDVDIDAARMIKDKLTEEYIEYSMVHELTHLKVGQGFDLARKIFEQFTEQLEERAVADFEFTPLVRKKIGKWVK